MKYILIIFVAITACASLSSAEEATPAPVDTEYLRGILKETWHCLDYHVSPVTGLPYDSSEGKDITNTTNVGLYLAALCMAYKLGYITEEYALARATKILDSLDTFGNWHRLYNNWLDSEGRYREAKPGDNNTSDYNKLPAGIIVVRQTFPQLAERCTAFLDEIPWEKFYDAASGKTCYAFDVVAQQAKYPVHFFRGEDKVLGHFLMIASGKVPASTWDTRDNASEEKYGVRYFQYGWQGGGIFMHLICGLFLDNRGTALGHSAANFAWAQRVHALRISAPVWGWSACVAPDGKYLGMGAISDDIVTPHASALAISIFPDAVADNLRRLESMGLRKPGLVQGKPEQFGFKDAVNWRTREITDKYLTLDQAMLFLAIVNQAEDGLLWKTFAADPLVRAGIQRIEEYRKASLRVEDEQQYASGLSFGEPGSFWLRPDNRTHYRPGNVIRRSLWGRSLSHMPMAEVRVQWKLADAKGTTITNGLVEFSLDPYETRKITELALDTTPATFGSGWRLESKTIMGGTEVANSTEDLRFPSYFDLAGVWKLKTGDDMTWAQPAAEDATWRVVKVPLKWEDAGLSEFDGTGWYRLHFAVPEDYRNQWGTRRLAIVLGGVDDADETFLNGVKVGASGAFPPKKETAYNTPRIYPFDGKLLGATNVLAIRVGDWMGNGGIWRGPVAVGPEDELREVVKAVTP